MGSGLSSSLSSVLMAAALRPGLRWGHSTFLWPGLPHSKHVSLLWLMDQSDSQSVSVVGDLNLSNFLVPEAV